MADRILLAGMSFEGRLGDTDEERRFRQPIEVDVALSLDLRRAGATDDLRESVDYARVHARVRRVVESSSFRLLEAVAEAVAREVLAAEPLVEEIGVHVRKPRVRLPGPIESAGVEIHRRRPDQDG
jgi:dihydroneopterin aldolase